jgi:8-oxo-dGTP diphosphatase
VHGYYNEKDHDRGAVDPVWQGRNLMGPQTGSAAFMQTGGEIEDGESASVALIRELREEIGFPIARINRFFWLLRGGRVNEAEYGVRTEDFLRRGSPDELKPATEIEEVCWAS